MGGAFLQVDSQRWMAHTVRAEFQGCRADRTPSTQCNLFVETDGSSIRLYGELETAPTRFEDIHGTRMWLEIEDLSDAINALLGVDNDHNYIPLDDTGDMVCELWVDVKFRDGRMEVALDRSFIGEPIAERGVCATRRLSFALISTEIRLHGS